MNPFANRFPVSQNWVIPISVLAFVLGVMIRLAWITEDARTNRLSRLSPGQKTRIETGPIDLLDQVNTVSAEVEKLRAENTKLQNAMGNQTKQSSVLNQSLQEAKNFASLVGIEGAGIIITLSDSRPKPAADNFAVPDEIIHDVDVLKVVNELWAAGAEAVSVNNHRVGPRTSFRCVGPVIQVDRVPIASPVVIRAIGDPDVLFGGLNLPGGVLDEIRQTDQNMVRLERAKELAISSFTGSTEFKFGKTIIPDESKEKSN